MSSAPFVSPLTRFVAYETNALYRQLADKTPLLMLLSLSPCVPSDATDTRVIVLLAAQPVGSDVGVLVGVGVSVALE